MVAGCPTGTLIIPLSVENSRPTLSISHANREPGGIGRLGGREKRGLKKAKEGARRV